MTYQNDYRLAEKLKKQFSGRGENVRGMSASSTEELVRRASMGRDPRENCAEAAFRESYRNHTRRQSSERTDSYGGVYSQKVGGTSSSHKQESRGYAKRSSGGNQKTRRNARAKMSYNDVAFEKITPSVEIKAKRKAISPIFMTFLFAFTAIVLFLIMQISDVYAATNEISELENELRTIKAEADELELKLEEKNDIREIERIATMEYGMTKEDTLQRRYVSISNGERIEVLEAQEEEASLGVMLSSIFSQLGKLFGGE